MINASEQLDRVAVNQDAASDTARGKLLADNEVVETAK
jgi:hypothetical protein